MSLEAGQDSATQPQCPEGLSGKRYKPTVSTRAASEIGTSMGSADDAFGFVHALCCTAAFTGGTAGTACFIFEGGSVECCAFETACMR